MTGLWQAFLSSIHKKVSPHVYENWFADLRYEEYEGLSSGRDLPATFIASARAPR